MGVAGLWELLRPAGQTRSLTHLSVVDGFLSNPDGRRGFRIGIDASIWFFHAAYGREGENPELRTLFFRCTKLMTMPLLPLFVFDGPKRPSIKRGKRISGNSHWMTTGMKNIIEAFGFEWRTAPGEAEAELAYLNRIGVIDAVLSDDVDNFLFGATMVIRNPSNTLSSNRANPIKNSEGRDDGNHAAMYKAHDILSHPDVQLTRGGCILIGLLSGGDYHQAGVPGCGKLIAHGLARCGFGDKLLEAAQKLSRDELLEFLDGWRQELRQELRTNSQGKIGSKKPSLAGKIPDDFPDIDILLSYTNPITCETEGKPGRNNNRITWDREPDLGKVAGLCELYFEWGVRDVIIKRFRTVLWPSAVLRILRRATLDLDKKASRCAVPTTPVKRKNVLKSPAGTPSKMIARHFSSMHLHSPQRVGDSDSDSGDESEERLVVKVHSSRTHASTDGVLEYRLEIAPAQLVHLSESGVKGIRPPLQKDDMYDDDDLGGDDDDEGRSNSQEKPKKLPPDPKSHFRVWMPACMVEMVEPQLVSEFEAAQKKKFDKKAEKRGTQASKRLRGAKKHDSIVNHDTPSSPQLSVKVRGRGKARKEIQVDDGSEWVDLSEKEDKRSQSRRNLKNFFPVAKDVSCSKTRPHLKDITASTFAGHKAGRIAADGIYNPVIRKNGMACKSLPSSTQVSQLPLVNEVFPLLDSEDEGEGGWLPVMKLQPLRPFPMHSLNASTASELGNEDPFIDERPSFHSSTHQTLCKSDRVRNVSTRSFGSDSSDSRLTKSPKKSPQHKSPPNMRASTRCATTRENGQDHVPHRAASPSPLKSPAKSNSNIIDISSDSDGLPSLIFSKLNRAPLLVARARARSRISEKSLNTQSTVRTSAVDSHIRLHKRDDILDLT